MTGVVRLIRHERDGDMHINVQLDAPYASMVNARNRAAQNGDLVIEIVPADAPWCVIGKPPQPKDGKRDYGICTGLRVQTPPLGARVRVTGPYVVDTLHGWTEIHPVWRLEVLDRLPSPPATQLRLVSIVPDPVIPGRNATLTALSTAGSLCHITVRYPSGTVSTAKGLVQKNADAAGRVTWTWFVGSRTREGIGTAWVSCGGLTDEATFTVA